ncbi:MAG: DUF1318 domain-containing protein [Kiritimatiellae bacterium]|nr:DUF1318 domain-containing protein [Kiritimatiellia bacterium]
MRNFTCIALSALAFFGCLAVKTEHEVKPIEINMNINLKMDKQLEEIIAKEEKPSIKALLDKGAIGIDNRAMLVPRGALSSAEFELVAEANARRKGRLETVAAENGETYDAAAAAAAEKFVGRIPEGKGVWYQTRDGDWVQR